MPHGRLKDQGNVYTTLYVLRDKGNLIISHFVHVGNSKSKPLITTYATVAPN
jgi:hypothetical protein